MGLNFQFSWGSLFTGVKFHTKCLSYCSCCNATTDICRFYPTNGKCYEYWINLYIQNQSKLFTTGVKHLQQKYDELPVCVVSITLLKGSYSRVSIFTVFSITVYIAKKIPVNKSDYTVPKQAEEIYVAILAKGLSKNLSRTIQPHP